MRNWARPGGVGAAAAAGSRSTTDDPARSKDAGGFTPPSMAAVAALCAAKPAPAPQAAARAALSLPAAGRALHAAGMFAVTEAEAAMIRAAYERDGEEAAADELRRLFPAFADRADAQALAVGIAGWRPTPVPMPKADPE